ncbi:MAG: hypothetical protein COA99_10125 [Moraxellaceae bacterium]|nr:MAG: hypothetical protein COA99_10125 [Moraxellaceae bacterium]
MNAINGVMARGVILVMVMLLLLSISFFGVSALRNGFFQQLGVNSSQKDVYALQAAESAINGVLIEGQRVGKDSVFFQELMKIGRQVNCLQSGVLVSGKSTSCLPMVGVGLSQSMASSGYPNSLYAYAITEKTGALPVAGYDVEHFSFHLFDTTGVGYLEGGASSYAYAYANTQRWKRFGISVGFDALKPKK